MHARYLAVEDVLPATDDQLEDMVAATGESPPINNPSPGHRKACENAGSLPCSRSHTQIYLGEFMTNSVCWQAFERGVAVADISE